MYFNKRKVKNLTMALLLVITTTLLIPYSSLSSIVLAYKSTYEYNPSSYPPYNYDNDDYYYEGDKQYYYHYPLKEKTGDLRDQVQNCKECFFSELGKLDEKVVFKILYEIDREFGHLENLCKLILNEKIDRDTLERILIEILSNLRHNSDYNNSEDRYHNNNYDNGHYYNDAGASQYNENIYEYDYGYILDQHVIKQIVEGILDCIFNQIAELFVVWLDTTLGNSTSGNPDIFIAKSTDGGETFSTPENISNNEGFSGFAQIAVNGNNLYVVWHDGTDTPGSREIFIAKSTDGGETFGEPKNISNNNGFSLLPQIAVNGDNVYVVWNDDTDGFDEIFIAKSTDGGETFSTPENISEGNLSNNASFSYQPSIAVNDDNVYVVWHEDPLGKRIIFVAKSNDGGETFGEPENISDKFDFSSKSAIAIEGNNVFVAWMVDIPNNNDLFVAKSTDGGETFGEPENISNNDGFSNYPSSVTTSSFEPSIAVNGDNVYVGWSDGTPGNFEILLSKSTDGGETFSTPENISNNEGFSLEPDLALLQ